MSAAADRLYAIVRQLCDERYRSPDMPTDQDMVDAVIAYEAERGPSAPVPHPDTAKGVRVIHIPNPAWFVQIIGENWPGGAPHADRIGPAVRAMHCDLERYMIRNNA